MMPIAAHHSEANAEKINQTNAHKTKTRNQRLNPNRNENTIKIVSEKQQNINQQNVV